MSNSSQRKDEKVELPDKVSEDAQGNKITVGNVVGSKGVAAGPGARAEVYEVHYHYGNIRDQEATYLKNLIAELEAHKGLLEYVELSAQADMGDGWAPELALLEDLVDERNEHRQDLPPLANIQQALTKYRRFVLVGEPGAGKTTALRHLALRAAHTSLANPHTGAIPLLLHLRKWADESSIADFVRANWPFDTDPIKLLAQGSILLLLDGLNEMGALGDRKATQLRDWLHGALAPKQVVITCRRIDYFRRPDPEQAPPLDLKLDVISIQKLDELRIRQFVINHLGDDAEVFFSQIAASPHHLSRLAQNPFFLSALIFLYKHHSRDISSADSPILVVRQLAMALWDRERQRQSPGWVPFDKMETAFRRLAFAMSRDDMPTEVPIDYALVHIRSKELLTAAQGASLVEVDDNRVSFYHQVFQDHFGRRLNPFALPVDSITAQVLQILASLMLFFSLGAILNFAISAISGPISRGLETMGFPLTPSWPLYSVGVIFVVLIVALILYRTHPARIRRRHQLQKLDREKDPDLYDAVHRLAGLVGISPPPVIEVDPRLTSVVTQVYGFRKRYVLRIGRGFRLFLRKSPAGFQALILHAFVPIVRGRVIPTYFSGDLHRVLVICLILLSILSSFARWNLATGPVATKVFWTIAVLFQLPVTLSVLVVIRSNLMRLQVIYSDLRVASWNAEAALVKILGADPRRDRPSRLLRRFRMRPSSADRLRMLRDPGGLFTISSLPVSVGILLAFILQAIHLLAVYLESIHLPGYAFAVTAILLWIPAYLLTATVGTQILGESLAETVTGNLGIGMYVKLWKPVTMLSLGVVTGIIANPQTLIPLLHPPIHLLGWVVNITLLTWLWSVYARFFALRTLGRQASLQPPHQMSRLFGFALAGLYWALCLPVFSARSLIAYELISRFSQISGLSNSVVRFAIILSVYLFISLLTWVIVSIYNIRSQAACPSCKHEFRKMYVLGQVCEKCGHDLAPWLFSDPPVFLRL